LERHKNPFAPCALQKKYVKIFALIKILFSLNLSQFDDFFAYFTNLKITQEENSLIFLQLENFLTSNKKF
jgi:hypothetical protein